MPVELIAPKLGLTMTSGTVTEWMVAPGAEVGEGDVLYLMTTDKTETEVEADGAGTLHPAVGPGTVVEPGAVVGWLLAPGEEPPAGDAATGGPSGGTPAVEAPVGGPSTAPAPEPAPPSPLSSPSAGRVVASPYARRRAEVLDVDLSAVAGTGPGGRIVAADVEEATAAASSSAAGEAAARPVSVAATPLAGRLAGRLGLDLTAVAGTGPGGRVRVEDVIAAAGAPAPAPAAAPLAPPRPAPGDRVPLGGMRKVIAERMTSSLREAAQLTLHREVEVDALLAFRADLRDSWDDGAGPLPSLTDLVVKAVALALPRHPLLNSSLVGEEIRLHPVVDVGVAVAVPDGLLVPVARSADELPLAALAALTRSLATKAREGRLAPSDVEASTFTVSALGAAGIDTFTPILNSPNVAILGVGRVREAVAWVDGAPVPSSVMGLSLTIDHRVVDGAPGAAFLAEVARLLAAPLRLVV